MGAASHLNLQLLGAPQVHTGGGPFSLNHHKARALLYYLAVTGQPHTREHLATLLWSESTTADAYHSLRSALYHLRRALRAIELGERLVEEDERLHLATHPGEVDVDAFNQLLEENTEGSVAQAVTLYRGAFLQGFNVSNAPLFEEWVRLQEASLGQACHHALARLANWAESRQAWQQAIEWLHRAVQADPLDEDSQQRLIRLYLRQGLIGLALRQYQQFELHLRQELNAVPSPETRALVEQALERRPSHTPDRVSPHAQTQTLPTLPLSGRDHLLADLLTISQETAAGRGTVVILEGENGIGKTRLLEEWANRLAARSTGWMILRTGCSPFDDLHSYSPMLQAFQNSPVGDLTEWVAEPDESMPDARGRFFHRILNALRTLAQQGPLLFAVDDLQWANSSTLNLFGFLAMRLGALPVLLAGTTQRVETIPALQRLVMLGRPRKILHLFSLKPFALQDTTALLQQLNMSAASAAPLAEWLHERSGGSPFVLGEILAQLRAEEIIVPSGKGTRLDATRWLRWRAAFSLPETTRDLVAWRLANLSANALYLLDVLAVAGQPLSFDLLQAFPGSQSDQLTAALEELVSRRLVIETEEASFDLPHHLLRETLLQRMSHIRHRTLHRRLAEVLERSLAPGSDLRPLARHAIAGEDVARARKYGLAVLESPPPYSGTEVVEFVQHLYDLLAPTASPDEKLRLTHTLGRLHQSLGDLAVAQHWHQNNLEIARAMGDETAQARAFLELGEGGLVVNDYRTAAESARAALALCETSGSPTSTALIGRGRRLLGAAMAMEGSDLAAAEEHLQAAVVAQRGAGSRSDLCAALFELGNIAAQRGDLQRALALYLDAAQDAEAGSVHYYAALAWNNYAYHSLLLGEIPAARSAADASLKLAETYQMLGVLLYLYSTRGEINLYLGEWTAAAEWFRRGLSLAEELGSLERQAGYRAGLALAAEGQGDLSAAIQLLEEALGMVAGQGYWDLQTRIQLWLAGILIQRGDLALAEPHLDAARVTARSHGRALWQTQEERLRARWLAARGDWPAADHLFSEALEHAAQLKIPIQVAETQAAWGMTALACGAGGDRVSALLGQARATLQAHGALAKLHALAESASNTGDDR